MAKAENKTKPTDVSVESYLAAIENEARRTDCATLPKLMSKITKQKPVMWGPSIVGFGSYHYQYESGREGDSCIIGFSSRKSEISIYLTADFPGRGELLAKLGKHKVAVACLYIKTLSDVDIKVLEKLIAGSYIERNKRHL
ncbi:MAG: DUF1801 domain-containing protein [Rhodocyclaceae bacterium]|nr:DUF1801 domain-containing protein [Rhodocyclaceae bacterium]